MGNTQIGGIQIVRVTVPGLTVDGSPSFRLWVAAVPREQAVAAVEKVIPRGCKAALTDRHLTAEEASRFKLRPGDVREMSSAT
jgi:hypothetical protein